MKNTYIQWDENTIALMRVAALEFKKVYESPLAITETEKEFIAKYKGGKLFYSKEHYSKKEFNKALGKWIINIDKSINDLIQNFSNPIFREVFKEYYS